MRRLSLCMIVRNEAERLPRCLASVRDLVDEMIVVDTGSTDTTIDIAQRAGAQVLSFTWCDDFSAARNASLAAATGDWILVLDADETIAAADHAAIRAAMAVPEAVWYALPQTTYTDRTTLFGWQPNRLVAPEAAGHPGYYESPLVRLFRRDPALRFAGTIHEHVMWQGERFSPVPLAVRIHHDGGYADQRANASKGALYLRLSEEKCATRPYDAHAWYELGVQRWMLDDGIGARAALDRAIALQPRHELAHWAQSCLAQRGGRWRDALAALLQVIAVNPQNANAYACLPGVLEMLGELSLAERVLDDLQPAALAYPLFCLNASNVYLAAGNPRKAARMLDAVPPGAEVGLVALNRARCRMELGEGTGIRAVLEPALHDTATAVPAHELLTNSLLTQNALPEAADAVAQLLERSPEHARGKFLQIVIALRRRDVASAKRWLHIFDADATLPPDYRVAIGQMRELLQVPLLGACQGGSDATLTASR